MAYQPSDLVSGAQRAPETGATKFTIRQNDSLLDRLEDISCLLTKDIGSQALYPSCQIPGALGYAVAGRNYANLLPLSFGHVLLIEFALLAPFSLFTVRYGINGAYHMQKLQMGIARSGYLILISVRFVTSLGSELPSRELCNRYVG